MIIFVLAKPHSRKPGIKRLDKTHFEVAVSSPAVEGRANEAVVQALAGYFDISQSQIEIIRGHKGKHKIFKIETDLP